MIHNGRKGEMDANEKRKMLSEDLDNPHTVCTVIKAREIAEANNKTEEDSWIYEVYQCGEDRACVSVKDADGIFMGFL